MSLLTRIQLLLRSMDDDALAALANKGLLRRAKKDLESVTPEILETTDAIVRIRVDDCDVTIPEIPANARSNSPAGSVDRYVLMAFLWLRDQNDDHEQVSQSTEQTEPAQTPESLDDETLTRWAGKALFHKTLKSLADDLSCVIKSEQPLIICVPQRNIICRWMTGGNLDTMIVTGPDKNPKSDGLLAILLYQIAKGIRIVSSSVTNAPEASGGAPRTRNEVLDSLGTALREMIVLGLTRLSVATQQRLQTLAVSAHGVDLPRLERMIQSLADDVALQRNRNARASTVKLLVMASQVDALRRAIKKHLNGTLTQAAHATPLADLIGEHRSRYHAVGDIELIGMGARRWTTKSGYVGLTIYFWDQSANNWATWSESRPVGTPGFDPIAVYHGDGPWQGCPSPLFAGQNLVKLLGAYRNGNGRLSARRATQAIVLEIDDACAMLPSQIIDDWSSLQERAKRLFGGGLARRNEQDEIVFLKPSRWDAAVFHEIKQQAVRPVFDAQENMLPLLAVHDETNAAEKLEKYDPATNQGVLGLLRLSEGTVVVEPVAFFDAHGIQNLTLDMKSAKTHKSPNMPQVTSDAEFSENEEMEEDADDVPVAESSGRVGALLRLLQSELESLAESGLGVSRNNDSLVTLADQLKTIGLTICATPLERFLEERRRARQSLDAQAISHAAAALLEAYHIIELAVKNELVYCGGVKQ